MKKAGFCIVIACLLFLVPVSSPGAAPVHPPSIRALGAARTVGGSAYLIDAGYARLLVDFGSIPDEKRQTREEDRSFDPASIDYVLVTHAHIDHAGQIPALYRRGFRGRVIGTAATRALLRITLEQSLNIMEERGGVDYERADVERMFENYLAVPYDKEISPAAHLRIRLRDAGHILGSAMFELWIRDRNGPIKIVATGDMGSGIHPLLPQPAAIDAADYIIVESTYGPFRRAETDFGDFGREVRKTLLAGGSVLIPAFALDRTQKVLGILGQLKREGVISADVPVYADSRTAGAISRVYRRYRKNYNPDLLRRLNPGEDPLSFPGLRHVAGNVSLAAHETDGAAIFLTSSGMLDHGQAPRHLERMIGDQRNLLAIVGWQAPGTVGFDLQQGAATVRIPEERRRGESVSYRQRSVKMQVKTFGAFSSHADGCGMLRWLSRFSQTKKVIVVHGEEQNAAGLARAVGKNLGFPAIAPVRGDPIPLSSAASRTPRRLQGSPCQGIRTAGESAPPAD